MPANIEADEEDGEVFVCVSVLRATEVVRNLNLRISTADGTAIGKYIRHYMESAFKH